MGLDVLGRDHRRRERECDDHPSYALHCASSVVPRSGAATNRFQSFFVVPIGDEDLPAAAAVTVGRPRELRTVGRRDREPVEAVGVGHPHRIFPSSDIHHVDLEVGEPELVRRKKDVLPRRVRVRRPAHRPEIRHLVRTPAVRIHRPHVGDEPVLGEPAPYDALTVGGEKGPAVVAGHVGQPRLHRAVGFHDVDLGEVRRVDLELLLLFVGELAVVSVAHRREHDPLAVGRIAPLGIVAE